MKNKVLKYLLITFGISWICWLVVILFIQFGLSKYPDVLSCTIEIIGTLAPTIASIMLLEEKKNFKNIVKFIFKKMKKLFCM